MENQIDMSVEFAGLKLANPVWTASGTCGYADELGDFMDVSKLGGFITKSVTIKPRQGNPTPRIVETDGGMLNAIGLANVGVDEFIAEKLSAIEKMPAGSGLADCCQGNASDAIPIPRGSLLFTHELA